MDVEKIPTKKVSDQVVEQIEQWIQGGDVTPGDKLPSVRELCAMFAVGRSAVRDAITTLKGKGLVEVRHGEGTFIRQMEAAQAFHDLLRLDGKDINDLYTVRKMMEIGTAELASQDRQEQHLVRMNKAIKALEEASEMDGWEADYQFHMAIAQATQNDVLVELMDTLSHLMKKTLKGLHQMIASDPGIQDTILEQHVTIYEAIKSGRPQQSKETMLVHLAYVEELLHNLLKSNPFERR